MNDKPRGGTRAGAGRPRLPEAERRTVWVRFKVTPEEDERLRALSRATRVPIATLMREHGVNEALRWADRLGASLGEP